MIPTLTFAYQNVYRSISSFYGDTGPLYHVTQSLPIMLFPIWYWWVQGFLANLLPTSALTKELASLDRPQGLKTLSQALTIAIAILSCSPHSEWRFLHPFLPCLLLFALPAMFPQHVPNLAGRLLGVQIFRNYVRLPKLGFYVCLFAPILPYFYLNYFHGRAQVEAIEALRKGYVGNVTGLAVLAPCHSTPWMSSLHKDVSAWFLTCEPPLEWVV